MRSTSRLTGAAKKTVERILVAAGTACAEYHDKVMRNLNCRVLQVDEIWAFCGCKEGCVARFVAVELHEHGVINCRPKSSFNGVEISQRRVFILALVSGCASPNGIDDREGRLKAGESTKVSLGMTKLEAMRALGKPETISADSSGETLFYRLERPWWQDRPFQVKIVNDKVISFGVIEVNKQP